VADTIWIVEGVEGQYSDRTEWAVAWCSTEEHANALAAKCTAELASLTETERHEYHWNDKAAVTRAAKMVTDKRGGDYDTEYRVYSIERWQP
jgi:hypothetical protein